MSQFYSETPTFSG